jgi:very-short-patch-repair endonuclease
LEVTCPRWLRTTQPGLVVHEATRVPPEDVVLVDDLPVYRPERVALQLAGIYRSPNFVESVLQAMRRKRLITYESTLRMFQMNAGRGVRGTRAMRVALELWDPTHRATESEMETLLLQVLRARGITDVVPQHEVFDADGRFIARVDAAVLRWKAAVEYDSKQEHSDEFQIARDNSRRNRLRAAGWHPVVARHRDLLSGGGEVVAAIRACAGQSA